jgi:hypothetical protein
MATVLAIAIAAARAFSIVVTQLVVDEKKYLCFHVVLMVSWSHGLMVVELVTLRSERISR